MMRLSKSRSKDIDFSPIIHAIIARIETFSWVKGKLIIFKKQIASIEASNAFL